MTFNDDITVVLAGEAGQGIQTIEALLTQLLKGGGYHVFATKEYMSRVRGGLNSTTIRVASRRVKALRETIDILIALHKEAIPHLSRRVTDRTIVIGEKAKMDYTGMIDVPLTNMAAKLGNSVYANIIAVGMVAGLFGIGEESLLAGITNYFSKKEEGVREKNRQAGTMGLEIAAGLANQDLAIVLQRDEAAAGEIMLTGAEAVALGALAGGCNYLCAYPMSPSTAVFTQIAAHSRQFDVIVEQVEDEIGVINMAIGASYAGARAMVTTSGGGFALMTEGISLAGMIEAPLVVHLAQRPGPATGLPTRTEQGDLELVLYAGHGAFPRIIMAPGSMEEAFYLAQLAFNLADRYQAPVFLLTDQYLIDTYYNIPPFPLDKLQVEGHIIETDEGYQRFSLTETGISPRGIPGFGRGIVCVDSDEHDEGGYITEDPAMRVQMVEKRLRKYGQMQKDIIAPSFAGSDGYETLVVGWGSTYNVIAEACGNVGKNGLAHLHLSWLYPMHREVLVRVQEARRVIVVEGNATGQLGQLLQRETGRRTEGILKYNGLPFSVEELTSAISDRLN